MGKNRFLARVFFLYDVLNDFVVDSRLSKMQYGEKTLLMDCLPAHIDNNSIVILDRGFGNFCTLKELTTYTHYCVRLSANNSNFAKTILSDERDDFITIWNPSNKEKENCHKNGLDTHPLMVRVAKIQLKTGEIEILVTSLIDQQKYTIQDLSELYNLRWGVEEGFKNLKPKMKIEHFGTKKVDGIFQEFYAHIFTINMVGLTGLITDQQIEKKTNHRRWEYKYNWKNAYRFLRTKMMKILLFEEIGDLFDQLLERISSSLVAIKPDRQFIRDTRNSQKKGRITPFHK